LNKLWRPGESISTMLKLWPQAGDCSATAGEVYCEILNGEEILCAPHYPGKERRAPFPVARLKITLDEFDDDFFTWGLERFVSQRLREVMALDSSTARFFEVDAGESAPLPRSKNYNIMEVAAIEDVLDLKGSDYKWRKRRPGMTRRPIDVRRYAFRAAASPKHDLFYDRRSMAMLCTDAFALRVLKADIKGMTFNDPNHPQGRYFFRTLRGIEEYLDWDPVNKAEVTSLVQTID
jgi:hypothetical protein